MLNPQYLEYVKQQACIVCGVTPVDAHHAKTKGSGGSDLTAVPLCRYHHRECHDIGRQSFQEKYQFDFRDSQLKSLQSYVQTGDII